MPAKPRTATDGRHARLDGLFQESRRYQHATRRLRVEMAAAREELAAFEDDVVETSARVGCQDQLSRRYQLAQLEASSLSEKLRIAQQQATSRRRAVADARAKVDRTRSVLRIEKIGATKMDQELVAREAEHLAMRQEVVDLQQSLKDRRRRTMRIEASGRDQIRKIVEQLPPTFDTKRLAAIAARLQFSQRNPPLFKAVQARSFLGTEAANHAAADALRLQRKPIVLHSDEDNNEAWAAASPGTSPATSPGHADRPQSRGKHVRHPTPTRRRPRSRSAAAPEAAVEADDPAEPELGHAFCDEVLIDAAGNDPIAQERIFEAVRDRLDLDPCATFETMRHAIETLKDSIVRGQDASAAKALAAACDEQDSQSRDDASERVPLSALGFHQESSPAEILARHKPKTDEQLLTEALEETRARSDEMRATLRAFAGRRGRMRELVETLGHAVANVFDEATMQLKRNAQIMSGKNHPGVVLMGMLRPRDHPGSVGEPPLDLDRDLSAATGAKVPGSPQDENLDVPLFLILKHMEAMLARIDGEVQRLGFRDGVKLPRPGSAQTQTLNGVKRALSKGVASSRGGHRRRAVIASFEGSARNALPFQRSESAPSELSLASTPRRGPSASGTPTNGGNASPSTLSRSSSMAGSRRAGFVQGSPPSGTVESLMSAATTPTINPQVHALPSHLRMLRRGFRRLPSQDESLAGLPQSMMGMLPGERPLRVGDVRLAKTKRRMSTLR